MSLLYDYVSRQGNARYVKLWYLVSTSKKTDSSNQDGVSEMLLEEVARVKALDNVTVVVFVIKTKYMTTIYSTCGSDH